MRDDKILDQILNQFAKQLKVKVYGTDIQGKLLKNAGVESTILSLGELTGPEKKMYQDNFSKTGTLQSGQIVMVVSPGIRSLYDSNWDVKPKVVLYQEQA